MITISLCMIVKNEERNLDRCLSHAAEFADEIILVDTGSEDRTKEIGAKYTDKIYDFPWRDDFAAARNEAFSHGTMDYCMWLDADDVITAECRKGLQKLKRELSPDTDMVMMKYVVMEDAQGIPLFSFYRERLVRRQGGFRWTGRVHEVIPPCGKVVYSELAVIHRKTGPGDPDRNLRIYEAMIREGETLTGRSLFYYGRELMTHGRTREAVQTFEKFLSGEGWIENKIEACLNLAECLRTLDEKTAGVRAILETFLYGTPRGEACVALGRFFQEEGRFTDAIYWYETALTLPLPSQSGAFVREDCYGYIPEANLCVCYDRLGYIEKAYEYHQKAKARRPEAPEVRYNEEYFRKRQADEPNLFHGHMIH